VIELFSSKPPVDDVDDLVSRAERSRNDGDALQAAVFALQSTHAREASYARATRIAARLFEKQDEPRAALALAWYTGDLGRERELFDKVPATDRARTLARWAEAGEGTREERYRAAATELEQDDRLVRAAIYYERAGDMSSARAFWSRLAGLVDAAHDQPYAAGLAHFNLARTSKQTGDQHATRDACVAAVHRLEEAADRFESIGQRERSFDCYHVLIAIGELSGVFEHVLEGLVNAVRILCEDNLRFHALRLYEHGIALAERAGERAAAATLAVEMASYARKQDMPRLFERGTLRQAELWRAVADATLEQGGPTGLAENALLASLLAQAELGQYRSVGALYERLAALEGLEPTRRDHYARAATRYREVRDRRLEAADDTSIGRHVAPPDVWHVDLIEWEERGSASEACADLLLEPEEPDDRISARATLLGRLVGLGAEAAPNDEAGKLVAQYLGKIGLYPLLSPLEVLYARGSGDVRLAAVRALSHYLYKRTFVTLERALDDDDARVAREATKALERLRFDHSFDPLARIYQTARRQDARLAALRALVRIDLPEAAELALGALEHGGPEERLAAIDSLKSARGRRFVDLARAAYPGAPPRVRQAITEVLSERGVAP
jgi:HEAT repeats